MLLVVGTMLAGAPASAGTIGPANNGDLSFGDTTNWTIEDGVWVYEDVGGDHDGSLRSNQAGTSNHDPVAQHDTLADVGLDGSIDFKINDLNGSGGAFGVGFLGDPAYGQQTIATYNNNRDNRGYMVYFVNSWGTVTISLE